MAEMQKNADIVARLLDAPLHSAFELQKDLSPFLAPTGYMCGGRTQGPFRKSRAASLHINHENIELLYAGFRRSKLDSSHTVETTFAGQQQAVNATIDPGFATRDSHGLASGDC